MKVLALLALVACVAARSPDTHVVGGAPADPNEWPWQGGWLVGTSFSCGCSVVHANWIITAGHCVGGAVGTYRVELGSVTRESGTVITLASVLRHPSYADGYTPEGFTPYDIALVAPTSPIAVAPGSSIDAVPGLDPGVDRLSHTCFMTGWGRTCGDCPIPVALQEAQIPILDDATCKNRFPAAYNPTLQICIMDPAGVKGACNGDSGGPLVCRVDASSRWELVGVTSYVASGCLTTEPSVFARVSYFQSWLYTESNGDIGTPATH